MPYKEYWDLLKKVYGIDPEQRDGTKVREIHTIRFMTLNYCPMRCTFCSYTNFLDAASGEKRTHVWRLPANDVVSLVRRACKSHPDVKTLIFQDDLFTFKK